MMYELAILISGLSIVLSIFLLGITRRVTRRRRARILSYIGAVFIIILISNVVFVLQVFSVIPFTGFEITILLGVELLILILFYAAIVRGIG
ncbi:hypothetical protein IX51_09985 [uncultured archaeon]|nr:hypothetical protein IX51_09985 [uncultured archaeon]